MRQLLLGAALGTFVLAHAGFARADEPQPALQPTSSADDYSWGRRFQLERPPVIRAVPGANPPAGYEEQTRFDSRRVIGGSIMLGVGYAMTVGASLAAARTEPQNFIPCAGPFFDTHAIPSDGDSDYFNSRAFAVILLAATGCGLEIAGTIELLRGVLDPRPVFVRSDLAGAALPRFTLGARTSSDQVTLDARLRF